MDYEILQDGDFYDDPNLSTEELPWLYTVVEVGYTSPQGFQMEIFEYLYLPENNELLEDMAESMTLGAQYTSWVNSTSTNITQLNTITIRRTDVNVDDFDFQPDPCYCDPTTVCTINPMCEGGGGGGVFGGGGQSDYGIFVEEQTVCNQQSRIVPLRHVAVVAKRWFKFWRGYTNNSGQFTVNKTFRNKVKVIVKTKNEHAIISKVRGIRLWQMLLPCRKRIGIFNGNELLTIRHVFTKPADGDAHNKELTYWAAATTHNSVIEFKDYTTEFNLRQPPDNLRIMVTNWGFMENAAATPMWNKCHNDIIPNYFAEFFISSGSYIGPGTTLLANTLKNRMDIIIGYKSTDYTCMLTSSQLRSTVYHEMGHAQHFSQVGCNFWADYRNAIATELSKLNQTNVHPYGTGSDQSTAPIIATGEMWGNHCEKWYSERHYGNGGGVAANFISRLQSLVFGNDVTSGLNANYWAIENFNPNRIQDVHRWIPQGLPYDLFDNRNDNINLIIDNANGFTINLCFNALQSDVRSIPAFRDRLLFQNANAQQGAVDTLFQRYGY